MFIKNIKLSNFKGFISDDHQINFRIPDGITAGSGLNIFVGENNSGKSSVFEAIDFLRNGIKEDSISLVKSKLSDGSQPHDACIELTFCGEIKNAINYFVQANKQAAFNNAVNGKQELKAKRNTASCKKLDLWDEVSQGYSNPSGIDAPFKALFETNFIWADTNPNDEATFGATTLCGLLLKEIAKAHIDSDEYRKFQESFNQVFNSPNSELRQQISTIEQKVQRIFTEQFGQADIRFQFDELKIDSFFKNTSIFINDGVDIPMSEKGNGMQRSVALALLQVYAEELAHDSEQEQTKPFYLFIDEPEICLHPKGQTKLLEALLEISKTKQVFLTTHSPYFLVTPNLRNVGLFIFRKDGIRNVVEDASVEPMFPWSPTWGEINFKAYKLPTVELHNELYGRLQHNSRKFTEKEFEIWLSNNGIEQNKQWTREKNGNVCTPQVVTLQTFIRNHIHHPENQTMQSERYTEDELKQSIEEMIRLLSVDSSVA
ncbi:ATP-binding protein [Actinobacillus genomosp. 2]|uniref:ATP-dependent nuclease n=1 Tax=Actinobacillus genomosp. 2 TaxID=230709 RepID=UPI0024410B23|nr:AAA family ATPase [Actinobacillus genomosp. 2]WGE32516.1 ATP-binding protein [Actinobacillus genomosp. 2]